MLMTYESHKHVCIRKKDGIEQHFITIRISMYTFLATSIPLRSSRGSENKYRILFNLDFGPDRVIHLKLKVNMHINDIVPLQFCLTWFSVAKAFSSFNNLAEQFSIFYLTHYISQCTYRSEINITITICMLLH